jgi:hypothetical protein
MRKISISIILVFLIVVNGIHAQKKITVYAANLYSYSTLDKPKDIYPSERKVKTNGKKLMIEIKPQSLSVIRLPF